MTMLAKLKSEHIHHNFVADVFEDEAAKISSTVLGREEIKKASQKIIEKNQGKQRRKKAK